jgi:hypothetical protein
MIINAQTVLKEPIRVRFSKPGTDDGRRLAEFYHNDARRTNKVLLRTSDSIEAQAEKGLFVMSEMEGTLVGASTLFVLNGGHEIEFRRAERGVVGSISSVLILGKDKKDPVIPKGWGRDIHFTIPTLMALAFNLNLRVDIVATEIALDPDDHVAVRNRQFVEGHRLAGSPLKFEHVADRSHAFIRHSEENVVPGALNVSSPFDVFRAQVKSNAVSAAKRLIEIQSENLVRDFRPKFVEGYNSKKAISVDISALGWDHFLKDIVKEAEFFDAITDWTINASWAETRRLFQGRSECWINPAETILTNGLIRDDGWAERRLTETQLRA